jgi:GR25 family glycosyltransferase involved in LPS biosynthesis
MSKNISEFLLILILMNLIIFLYFRNMNYPPIYCINLKERTDRKKYTQTEFRKLDIEPDNVIFLNFYKHNNGGVYGCYDSHMKVWNHFYKNHLDEELCIIFEDDFEATENSILHLKKAISFIEKNKDKVDILFLHDRFIEYNNHDKKDTSNAYFTRGYGILTHVYIVTRKYIKSIIDKNDNRLPKPNGIHLDVDINMNKNSILYSENIFFCKDPTFIQKELQSDNYNNIFDKVIKKMYGNSCMFNIGIKVTKNIKLLLKNDKKTKEYCMLFHKLYVKK